MKERPIIFSGPMVRAILDGRKTQTRRVVKFNGPYYDSASWPYVDYARDGMPIFWSGEPVDAIRNSDYYDTGHQCPCGIVGDRLWVRETWAVHEMFERTKEPVGSGLRFYRATDWDGEGTLPISRWRPSIHMPRWASRITLEVTGVRVERIQDISFADCLAEGIVGTDHWDAVTVADLGQCQRNYESDTGDKPGDEIDEGWNKYAHEAFRRLWDSINDKRGFGWDANPWVWVIEFRRI